MMNHHLPAGPPQYPPAALPTHTSPMHSQSRRQQEYHQFHQQAAQNPYAAYHHPGAAYYGHPAAHMGYPPRQWMPHQAYAQYPMHQQPQYPPRSPLIVSSQPQMAGMPPPITRQPSMPYMAPPPPAPSQSPLHVAPVAQSPHPVAPSTPATSIPQSVPSPRPASVKTSTPPLPTSRRSSAAAPQPAVRRMPFYPDLPWYSVPSETFPTKASKRRRKRQDLVSSSDAVALPSRGGVETHESAPEAHQSELSTLAAPSPQETPATSQAPSEADVKTAAASSSQTDNPKPTTPQSQPKRDSKPAVPIIPAVPVKASAAARSKTASSETLSTTAVPTEQALSAEAAAAQQPADTETKPAESAAPAPKAAPKSWADLVRSKNAAANAAALANGVTTTNGASASRASSLAEALKQFDAVSNDKLSFLEPRGLVNTGNMCYMNSILQVLVSCMPFYNFLDQVSKRAAHSFKSDTPLVDAMIMFMREFKIIDSAETAEKLRMRLKDQELEQYGDSLTPEYVYDVIKQLPRFSSMRRGHQQDAEEFLGFMLAGMHDECIAVMRKAGLDSEESNQVSSPTSTTSGANTDAGWLEVGPKQKQSVTRQSGDSNSASPVTRIFGGSLRSELRVPGLKNSVTLEPYQPLQLDIGAPDVNNIIQAMKAITKPETLTGDFNSPRGPGTTATKQVFIESLPPVLILHLKRFQYDNAGGTQKIWKKVGYPLELEIPKDVFPPHKRGGLAVHGGSPKYRLISVVYHHGKSAAGGHYTVDILRQDEREWVRVDDTLIRRIRPEDVAEGGSEEDPKVLARALEQHKADQEGAKRNLFEGLDGDDDTDSVRSWNEVNGQGGTNKKWSSAAANSSGKHTPLAKDRGSIKDNKVAYILLYEKITG